MDFITFSTFVFLLGILVPTVKGTLMPGCFMNSNSKAKYKDFHFVNKYRDNVVICLTFQYQKILLVTLIYFFNSFIGSPE